MTTDIEREEARGNALEQRMTEEDLTALKSVVDDIRREVSELVSQRRSTAKDTRFCRWDGQSDDGRKHRDDLGKDAVPYEGASDARVRSADKIVNERVAELVLATRRNTTRLVGMDGTDEGKAGRLEILRQWVLNQWGDEFRRQVELLAQYQEGDSPGIGVALVDWDWEYGIEVKEVTAEELLAWWAETQRQQTGEPPSEDDLALVQMLMLDESRVEEVAALLLGLAPQVAEAEAKKAARRLVSDGKCRMPVKYLRRDGPVLVAKRLYEDVYFAANTNDPQRARMVVLREWLTRAEVLETAAREQWSREFVEQLVGDGSEGSRGHEGVSGLDDTYTDTAYTELSTQILDKRKGLYEVLTSLDRAVTKDGAVGIFERKWSYFCTVEAQPRRIFDRKHGKYPVVVFASECLTQHLIDARGVPERALTDQTALKAIRDSFSDHVERNTNPPILKPKGTKYSLQKNLGPFGEQEVGPRERLEVMNPAPYPRAAAEMAKDIRRESDEYFGRKNPEVADEVVVMLRQMRTDRFLSSIAEVFKLSVQLCQQYLPAEKLARIMGQKGAAETEISREEIQGQFDVRMFADVRDWDTEFVLKKTEMLLKVRTLDTRGQLPWEPFAASIVSAIDPRLAELIPSDVGGTERVVRDEQDAYGKILLGIRPPMPDWIENPQLRMQTLSDLHGPRVQRPDAFGPMSPASTALLDERVKYLQFQGQQVENAATGRRGVKEEPVEEMVEGSQMPDAGYRMGGGGMPDAGSRMGEGGGGGTIAGDESGRRGGGA